MEMLFHCKVVALTKAEIAYEHATHATQGDQKYWVQYTTANVYLGNLWDKSLTWFY